MVRALSIAAGFSLLFLVHETSLATTYYIKNGGDDGSTGTSNATAWASLTCIESPGGVSSCGGGTTVNDGDDFYLKQGNTWTITKTIEIKHAGTSVDDRSVFGCYEDTNDVDCSGARPIINADNNNIARIVWATNPAFLEFRYLDIRNIDPAWEDCVAGGNGSSTGIELENSNFTKGYNVVTQCRFFQIGHYAVSPERSLGHNIYTDNLIEYAGNGIYPADEGSGTGTQYDYYARNVCTNIVGYATCSNPSVKTDGHCIGPQKVSYSIMEHNISTDANGTYGFWTNEKGDIRGNVVRNNVSYGSGSMGFLLAAKYCDGGDWCASTDPGRDGHPNVTNNIFYNNTTTHAGKTSYRAGILVSGAQPRLPTEANAFFNNTVYLPYGMGLQVRYGSDHSRFANSIVVGDGWNDSGVASPTQARDDLLFSFQLQGFGAARLTFLIDYNLYWNALGDPTPHSIWRDIAHGDLAWSRWTDATRTWDQDGIVADPSFVSTTIDGFALKQGSEGIDAGRFLTNVMSASGLTITVADNTWFNGNYGLVDVDGSPVSGMQITFYDTTYGLQHRTITSDTITHAAPGSFVIDSALEGYVYGAASPTDPATTTQVALRFYGRRPDVGAKESNHGATLSDGGVDQGAWRDGGDVQPGLDGGDGAVVDGGVEGGDSNTALVGGGCQCGLAASKPGLLLALLVLAICSFRTRQRWSWRIGAHRTNKTRSSGSGGCG